MAAYVNGTPPSKEVFTAHMSSCTNEVYTAYMSGCTLHDPLDPATTGACDVCFAVGMMELAMWKMRYRPCTRQEAKAAFALTCDPAGLQEDLRESLEQACETLEFAGNHENYITELRTALASEFIPDGLVKVAMYKADEALAAFSSEDDSEDESEDSECDSYNGEDMTE